MAQPLDFGVQHHFSAGVYIKEMRLDAGHTVVTHKHNYEHFGLLGGGIARVEIDGQPRTYTAPAVITVPANKHHTIHALTNIEWFCIHATDETDPEKVDRVLIKGD